MKRLIQFACTLLLIVVLSCDITEENLAPGDIPAWVKHKADKLSAQKGESCEYIWVIVYEAQGKYYYNIDFSYSSCNNCNLFDERGNYVRQSELGHLPEMKLIDTRPACIVPK